MARKNKLPLVLVGSAMIVGLAITAAFLSGKKSPLYAAGTIKISKDLEAAAKGMRTLYLVALPSDGGRMPLGAARFHVGEDATGQFINFVLTPETMTMMPGAMRGVDDGSAMPEKFTIKARLDADGAGGMDQQGDLIGVIRDVTLGSRELSITIDQAVR